jgi:hypothetical protein
MTYTAPTLKKLNVGVGTDMEVLCNELTLIDSELDSHVTATGKAAIKLFDLTGSMVSGTSLAANGVDLASGTDATFYAVFCAPVAMTIVSMDTFLTEAYVKETTDAKIELKDNAGSPVTKVSYTLPTAGRAVKSMVSTTPVSAALAAGDIINLAITASASSTGTGHAKVFLRYTID